MPLKAVGYETLCTYYCTR